MDLSNDLISKFVKITNDDKNKNSESTVYGTVVEYNGGMYVRIDGSDLLTPVETTADFKPNERVTVMIKNHSATVTGNITSPSTNEGAVIEKVTEAVEDVEGKVITEVEILIADRVSTGQLDAEVARIDELIAGKASVEDLTATNAEITNLKADKASVKDLTATNARIDSLQANKADITYLDANFATIDELEAAHADIEILDAEVANINTLVNGNLTSDNILSLNITSQNTTMENAFVKDAMIDTVTANKIMSGTIDTNNVTIQSTDGSMLLQGTLLQMKDDNGKVRIQIGKDTGGNFTFILYDESGTGVLIDEEGIKSSDAIADGLIVDAKVADNANIAGSKLDIASVITEVNNDNSTTIKSNKIYLDEQGQSLEVAFNSLKTHVDTIQDVTIDGDLTVVKEQVQSNTTQIAANKEGISTLVSENTIRKEEIQNLDGEIESVNNTLSSKYSSLEQDVSGFKTTVADTYATKQSVTDINNNLSSNYSTTSQMNSAIQQKANEITSSVSETYTTKSEFNNLEIGGRNLVQKKNIKYGYLTEGTGNLVSTPSLNGNQDYYSEFYIPVKAGEKYAITTYNSTSSITGYIAAHIYDSNKTWLKAYTSEQTNLNSTTPISRTFTIEVDGYMRYSCRGLNSINTKLEKGNRATDWTPAPEDVEAGIDAVADNLANNYSTTSTMNSAIQQKANEITSSVSETYTTKTDFNNIVNNYATKSELTQTSNNITATFKATGGYNLLRNGHADKSTSYWLSNGGGISLRTQASGNANGNYFSTTLPDGMIYHTWIALDGNTDYVLQAKLYSSATFTGASLWPVHAQFSTDGVSNNYTPTILDYQNSITQARTWTQCYFHFKTPANQTIYIKPFIWGNTISGTVYATEIMLSKSATPIPWSPHPSEIYDGITTIDKDGIKIQHSNYSGYTHMAPAGFFVNDGSQDIISATSNGLYVKGNIASGSTIQGARITGSTFNSSNDVFQVLEDGTIETSFLAVNGAVSTDKLNVNNIENASYPKVLSEATTVYISPNGGVNAEEFYDGAYFTSLSNMLAVAPRNLNGYTLTIRMAGDLYENAALSWFHSGQVNFEMQGYTLYGYFYGYGASMCYRLYGNTNANNNGTWGHIKPNVGRALGSYSYAVQFQYCQFAINNIAVYPSASSGSSSGGISAHRGATGIVFSAKACGDMRYLVRAEYAGRVHVNSSEGACNNATFCASTGGIITLNSSNDQAGRTTTGNPYWVGTGGMIAADQLLGMDKINFNNSSQSGSSSSSGSTTRKVTETIKATSADTYRSTVYNSWKGDGTVRQGDYGYGDCQGCWFFGNNLYNTMNAGTVTKVVIRMQRQSGGVNAAQTLTVKSHNHTSRPSGAPTYTNTIGTCSCVVGSYVDLVITDSATINKLKTCKGLGLSIGSTSSPYAVCSGACSVIITYTTTD